MTPNPYESPESGPVAEEGSRPGLVMMIVKLVLGTIFGLATVAYLVQFIQVLASARLSIEGITDVATAFFALCVGALFTKWSFQSALCKRAPEPPEEESVDMALAPNAKVSWMLIVLTPLTFWIPVVGAIIAWITIRRARWVTMPDWIAFLLALLFFVAVAVTGACALIFGLPVLGVR